MKEIQTSIDELEFLVDDLFGWGQQSVRTSWVCNSPPLLSIQIRESLNSDWLKGRIPKTALMHLLGASLHSLYNRWSDFSAINPNQEEFWQSAKKKESTKHYDCYTINVGTSIDSTLMLQCFYLGMILNIREYVVMLLLHTLYKSSEYFLHHWNSLSLPVCLFKHNFFHILAHVVSKKIWKWVITAQIHTDKVAMSAKM